VSAYWRRHLPIATEDGGRAPAGARGSLVHADAIVIGRFRGTVIVTLHGALDLSVSAGLGRMLHDLIEGQGNLSVVVDLRDVGRIDSSGVDVLGSASDQIAARGGELRLGEPTGAVFDALALSGLATLIDVPFEGERRPSSPKPSRSVGRQASMDSHPAGKARCQRSGEGTGS
jgi:anti-anti-sigma factor